MSISMQDGTRHSGMRFLRSFVSIRESVEVKIYFVPDSVMLTILELLRDSKYIKRI